MSIPICPHCSHPSHINFISLRKILCLPWNSLLFEREEVVSEARCLSMAWLRGFPLDHRKYITGLSPVKNDCPYWNSITVQWLLRGPFLLHTQLYLSLFCSGNHISQPSSIIWILCFSCLFVWDVFWAWRWGAAGIDVPASATTYNLLFLELWILMGPWLNHYLLQKGTSL